LLCAIALAIIGTALSAPTGAESFAPEISALEVKAAEDAKATITQMLKSGKDSSACADLATSLLADVEATIASKEKMLNEIDDGSACASEGQELVDSANAALESRVSEQTDAHSAAAAAASAPVNFGSMALSSLGGLAEGTCEVFASNPAYTAAKSAKEEAATAATTADAAVTAARDAVTAAEEEQKKMIHQCKCKASQEYDAAYAAASEVDPSEMEAWTKAKHMQCVLAGTAPSACEVGRPREITRRAMLVGQKECASTLQVSYIGCFGDNVHRDLKHGPKNYGYSAVTCHEACTEYKYFALQNGGWCNCDNSYSDGYTPGDGKASYDAVSAVQCNVGGHAPGKGMGGGWTNAVYEMEPSSKAGSSFLTGDDFEDWTTGCTVSGEGEGTVIMCPQGDHQIKTKESFTAPVTVTLEMRQSGGGGDECGVFQLFGDHANRHNGFSAGMGWWAHYLGYGFNDVHGHGEQNKDGETTKWKQFTIAVDASGNAKFSVDGQEYGTKSGRTSGFLSLGMNCRDYSYRHIVVQK